MTDATTRVGGAVTRIAAKSHVNNVGVSEDPATSAQSVIRVKVIYASSTCSRAAFANLFQDETRMPAQQAQKYHRLMMQGLARNGLQVIAVASPPATRENSTARILAIQNDFEKGVTYRYLRVFNWSPVRNLAALLQSFVATWRELRSDQNTSVVCDVLNFSVATGALAAAKLLGRRATGIVTDIPRMLSNRPGPLVRSAITLAMRRYDSYLYLTQEMDSIVGRSRAPYIVIEGQVDIDEGQARNNLSDKHAKRVCMYAGALEERYGVDQLVAGFLRAGHPDWELHIYGTGELSRELSRITAKAPAVKYFGHVRNDRLVTELTKASLLVNPRPTADEFVKFSFPSKNMEYMVSGTPLLTSNLPGMPAEYKPHVYLLKTTSAEGIADSLRTLFDADPLALHLKGARAKRFVLEEKNNVTQAARLAKLILEPNPTRTRA